MRFNIKLLSGLLLVVLAASCVKDDSVGSVNEISEITIQVPRDELSVKFGYNLVCAPEVKQTIPGKELYYEWSARQADSTRLKVISTDKELNYHFEAMGKYYLRLKAYNEDGATFQEFTVNVDAAFEEGIMMLSVNEEGEGNIGFVRKLTDEEKEAGMEEVMLEHCFTTINPGFSMKGAVDIDKNLTDYGKTNGYLYVTLKDRIYVAHSRTFEWVYTVSFEDQAPTFKAKKMISADDYYAMIPLVYSEDGSVRALNPKGLFLYESNNYGLGPFEDAYDEMYYFGKDKLSQAYYVDYSTSTLWGYTYQLFNSGDMFKKEDIITLVGMNGNRGVSSDVFVVSRSKEFADSVYVRRMNYFDFSVVSKFGYKTSAPITVSRGMDLVPNVVYNAAYYAEGSRIYVWYPMAGEPVLPTRPVIDLNNLDGHKIVGCINASYDGKELYVGYYDTELKKGGLLIYDASRIGIDQDLKPARKFENTADRPVRVLYKSR